MLSPQEGDTMPKVAVTTEIAAPVEEVFALFMDLEHATQNVSGIKKLEIMSTGPSI